MVITMGIIPDEVKEHLKKELEQAMVDEVRVVLFTQEIECPFCKETREIVEEAASLSPKIKVEAYDFVKHAEKVKEFGIVRIPAIAIVGKRDYGIRFYGIPSGYEFTAFIHDIIDVSKGTTSLLDTTKAKLKTVDRPIHIQVFVLPTCPYCPSVVRTVHQFAIENELIKADMIETSEFPQLTQKYAVMGVPKTVINEKVEVLGAAPEERMADKVLEAQRASTDMPTVV